MCDRCRDPNKTDLNKYKFDKADAAGGETSQSRTLCDECADYMRASGVTLTGGRRRVKKDTEAATPDPAPDDAADGVPAPDAD